MEKYGFIYLWYDKKRRMFYIGSHWGTECDGYICSSNRMRDAYRRRPNDFKRKIIQRGIDRLSLLDEEHKWLSQISDDELGVRYYNLRKHKWGHWSSDENSRMSVGQKISASPNRAKNISAAMKNKKPHISTIEAIKKTLTGRSYEEIHGHERAREIKEKQKLSRKRPVWTEEMRRLAGERSKKHMMGRKATDETKMKMSASQKKRYDMREQNEKHL